MKWNGVRPKDNRQTRIWNSWNPPKFDWIPIRYWPSDLAEAVITEKLKNKHRFRLMIYLMGNGVSPDEAKEWLLMMGGHYFDNDAVRHINWLANNVDALERKGYTYWDEHTGRWKKFWTPPDARQRQRQRHRQEGERNAPRPGTTAWKVHSNPYKWYLNHRGQARLRAFWRPQDDSGEYKVTWEPVIDREYPRYERTYWYRNPLLGNNLWYMIGPTKTGR